MKKTKKYRIEVRNVHDDVLEVIYRTLKAVEFGNFNPIYCRFMGKDHLVHSEHGDLSDPFRREEHYLTDLYIRLPLVGKKGP